MGKLLETVGRSVVGQVLGWAIRQVWLYVLASGAIGATLAYLQELPLLYIYVAGLSAAALAMWILAQNSIRRTLSSPKDKIVVEALNPLHWPFDNQQQIQPQLAIKNLANFPIEIDVKETGWSMDGFSGKAKTDVQTSAVVSPSGGQVLRGPTFDRPLPVDDEKKAVASAATIKVHVQVRYGRPGNMKYTHSQHYVLRCWLDPSFGLTSVSMEQIGRGRFS